MLPKENIIADQVFTNGVVYTVDAQKPSAQAVAIKNGEIVNVGSDKGAEAFIGSYTRVIDLDGKMLLPGFHDVHVHLYDGGMHSLQCDLWKCQTPAQIKDRIRAYIHDQGPSAEAWIQCSGLQKNCTHGLNRNTLDDLVPERPLYILTFDGHSCLANTRALELAGIGKDTPDPPGGRIERMPGSTEPNGYLHDSPLTW